MSVRKRATIATIGINIFILNVCWVSIFILFPEWAFSVVKALFENPESAYFSLKKILPIIVSSLGVAIPVYQLWQRKRGYIVYCEVAIGLNLLLIILHLIPLLS